MRPLPPGPSAPAAIQTVRWLANPVAFLEDGRRRFGDAFSVSFIGFQRPMVVISDPAVIRALYSSAEHLLPPSRTIALRSIMGSRSILLLEGREHLQRRRIMLPPFHGERMRGYEDQIAAIARAEVDRWPLGEPFALHPRMRALTFEVILRVVFGVTERARLERLRVLLPRLLESTASPSVSYRVLLARRFGRSDPLARFDELGAEISEVLLAGRRVSTTAAP
jgi:cytochrome P450